MEENVNSDIEQSFSEIIDVHLKTVHGDIDTLRVSKDIKIKDLIKRYIELKNNQNNKKLYLSYKGKLLSPEKLLSDYQFEFDCILYVSVRMFGGIKSK